MCTRRGRKVRNDLETITCRVGRRVSPEGRCHDVARDLLVIIKQGLKTELGTVTTVVRNDLATRKVKAVVHDLGIHLFIRTTDATVEDSRAVPVAKERGGCRIGREGSG